MDRAVCGCDSVLVAQSVCMEVRCVLLYIILKSISSVSWTVQSLELRVSYCISLVRLCDAEVCVTAEYCVVCDVLLYALTESCVTVQYCALCVVLLHAHPLNIIPASSYPSALRNLGLTKL